MAILPSNPTSHSVALRQTDADKLISFTSRCQGTIALRIGEFVLIITQSVLSCLELGLALFLLSQKVAGHRF
jgi:hypothetical protein